MAEFSVHHDISQLVFLLGNKDSSTAAELYQVLDGPTNVKSGNTAGSHMTSPSSVQDVSQMASDRSAVLQKYKDLRLKNVPYLDPLMMLLGKIQRSPLVKDGLAAQFDTLHLHGFVANSNLVESTSRISGSIDAQGNTRRPSRASATNPDDMFFNVLDRMKQQQRRSRVPDEGLLGVDIRGNSRAPDWLVEPKTKSWDIPFDSSSMSSSSNVPGRLGALPPAAQERALIEDLLNLLQGVPGEYIVPEKPAGGRRSGMGEGDIMTFSVDPTVERTLSDLAHELLPLVVWHHTIVGFVDSCASYIAGLVLQALGATIESILHDYDVHLAELASEMHDGKLNLRKMNLYLSPIKDNFKKLNTIVTSIRKSESRGGQVLSLLHEFTIEESLVGTTEELCCTLTKAACVPYMKMLEKWVYHGVIQDPHYEFMVEDVENFRADTAFDDLSAPSDSDDYWSKRYQIKRDETPTFLKDNAELILRAGKYLNVISQCGKSVSALEKKRLVYTPLGQQKLADAIHEAYSVASSSLLQLIVEESDFMGQLRSVRHHFLMDQGDLILQFMHLAERELSKRLADVEGPRMEAFLELAQRTSTAKADPYKDHFRVTLIPVTLQDQMDERDDHLNFENMELPAWEALSFDYEAKWPVSLVLNRKALFCYQMIFRLLFYFKHVERLLCSSIPLGCKSLSPLNGTEAETEDGSGPSTLMLCFALRHKMLHFLQNLQTYIVQEVLKPNWEMFMERMAQVKTVDEVLEFHRDFLDTCLRDCMLTSPELLGALMKILKLSAHFTDLVKKRLSLEVNDGRSLDEATEEFATMFGQEVRTVDLEFNALIFGLLDSLNEAGRRFSENIYKLFFRMDYNNFYMTVIGKMPGGAPGVPVLASSNLELQMF